MKKPSVSIFFDKRNMKPGFYSVKWVVYYLSEQKYYATGLILPTADIEFLKKNKAGLSGKTKDEQLRNLWNQIYGDTYIDEVSGATKQGLLSRGHKALNEIESYFTFQLFSNVISGKYTPEKQETYPTDLLQALNQRTARLERNDQLSNANIHRGAARSFKKFAIHLNITSERKPEIPLRMITASFLKEYEKWMLKSGKLSYSDKLKNKPGKPASVSVIGMYVKNVRTVFLEAIRAKVIDRDLYPFGGDYQIPSSVNKKKALDQDVIYKIFNFECKSGSSRERARDLWVFSYLCNGLNITDICNLKYKSQDFKNGYIDFIRQKTKNSKRQDRSAIRILLTNEVLNIIEKWGNPEKKEDSYLFPFLYENLTAKDKKRIISNLNIRINIHMNNIGKILGVDSKINTYEARHSFATTLLTSEAPLAFISQSLGHSSFKTTQLYLGSFQINKAEKYLSALIPKGPEEQKPE